MKLPISLVAHLATLISLSSSFALPPRDVSPSTYTPPEHRFESFNIHSTSYKKIGPYEIAVNVLIPKTLKPGPSPLIAKFHGGGLVLGDALYEGWFSSFFIPFTSRNNAIIVSPNYRFLPESSGADIWQDVADFWTWFHDSLPAFVASVAPSVELVYEHLLLSGESAGGLIAILSSIYREKYGIDPKAVLAEYPMTRNVDNHPTVILGTPVPGEEVIDQHIASTPPGTIVTSSRPDATTDNRGGLLYALVGHDRLKDYYGSDPSYWPISAIEGEECEKLIPTMIFHGAQDSFIPVNGSIEYVERVEELYGKEGKKNTKLVVKDGDHGFTSELVESETGWLKDALKWVEVKWRA